MDELLFNIATNPSLRAIADPNQFIQGVDDFLGRTFFNPGIGVVGVAPGGFLPPHIAFAGDPLVDATRSMLIQSQVGSLLQNPLANSLLGTDFLISLTNPSAIGGGTTAWGLPTTTNWVNGILNSPVPVFPGSIVQAADGIIANGLSNPFLQASFGFDPNSSLNFGTQFLSSFG